MSSPAHTQAQALLEFIDVSPSPWHAVNTVQEQLKNWRFKQLHEADSWSLQAGGRYYVVRDDSSLIAFVTGPRPLPETGYKIVAAHTDSPGLRIKPRAAHITGQMVRLGVEVYGGPILATFSDRDLSLAGRISYIADDQRVKSRLLRVARPILRLPNLAIHMNRKVNEEGLKFDSQTELPLLFCAALSEQLPETDFLQFLQHQTAIEAQRILSWELNVYDTQPGEFWGAQREFIADSQLDNLASCHAGIQALLNETTLQTDTTLVCALFDHEEIGSESNKGADGSFLPDTLQRVAAAQQLNTQDYHRALARSFMISADMAHAYQPNFPKGYDPQHRVFVNQGPVIKINVNQRYATESVSAAHFIHWCEQAEVPHQQYSHRSDIPCGSTIGPMSSARMGIRSVDVGNPLWAMHSIRESAGVYDHAYMLRVLRCFFQQP